MADLRIKDLVVEYAKGEYRVRPIDGLSLDVSEGSLAILLGPSGCGKTTLLSCLGGILSPSAGRIEFGDIDLTKLDERELSHYRRNTVGIVFQAFNLVSSLTALENVMVPLRAARVPRREARKRAEELLDRVGLAHRMGHRPGDLSGGQQQRVAVARAIALDPPLILADEPTAHLDYIQVEEVLRLIRELASGERVVVVATHDTRMLPLADRVVELMPHIAYTEHEPDTVELQAGETLFEQGTMGDCIYVVSEGELEIVRELASGGEEVLKVAGPGDYFGEMGPVFGLPRSATVRALTAATVVGYTVQAFREKLGATGSRDIVEHRPLQWRTGTLAGNQTEQDVRSDRLDAVVAPPQRAGDGRHADVVDRGDRAAQQNRRHVGQDPVDHTGPQEGAGQRRATLDEDVGAIGQRRGRPRAGRGFG